MERVSADPAFRKKVDAITKSLAAIFILISFDPSFLFCSTNSTRNLELGACVDTEVIRLPKFMINFSLIRFLEGLTFALLLWVHKVGPHEVRTGWFKDSASSASLIVLVIPPKISYWRIR
jgi:hypothetical protein